MTHLYTIDHSRITGYLRNYYPIKQYFCLLPYNDTTRPFIVPQVGAISKAQKAQNIFFGKKLEIFEKISFGNCRTVPKNVKGGTLFDL